MSSAIFDAPVAASGYVGLSTNPPKSFPVKDSIGENCLQWFKNSLHEGNVKSNRYGTQSTTRSLRLCPTFHHSDDSIAKEIDYMLKKGWIPCLEFAEIGDVYRENSTMPGYYDGRYWTLWMLPMFGCTDPSLVLNEIYQCKTAYPNAYIRCMAFDNINQGQCMAFIIQKPTTAAARVSVWPLLFRSVATTKA